MDKIMLFVLLIVALLNYLEVVLEVLSRYRCAFKINKIIYLGPFQYFMVIDVTDMEKSPSTYKYPYFEGI